MEIPEWLFADVNRGAGDAGFDVGEAPPRQPAREPAADDIPRMGFVNIVVRAQAEENGHQWVVREVEFVLPGDIVVVVPVHPALAAEIALPRAGPQGEGPM